MAESEETLLSWWEGLGPKTWFAGGEALDAECRARFLGTWEAARDGRLGPWLTSPRGALAYIVLTDQMPRNMFRGKAEAFATDGQARSAAKAAVARDWDLRVTGPMQCFFYMPLEHSENLVDQDRAVRLFACRMPEAADFLLHAKAHREVIRTFGRFPFRNAALGRTSSPEEAAWLEAGGYGAIVRRLEAEAA